MTLISWSGTGPIFRNGAVGAEQACCCGKRVCILQQSGAVAGITGSDVVFDGGGGSYATLNFSGVNGYWLGRHEGGVGTPGYNQSVTITFTTVKPFKATLRCSALDCALGQEKLNYSFTGASGVVFTADYGSDLTDDGATVTRPPGSTGDSRFSLVASGTISEIYFQGEMISNGTNGVIAEICVEY